MSFDRYIASVSFGKDSLAMVLLILERGLPLDEVVFYDTGMEFLKELRNIRTHLPKYWNRLKDLQSRTDRPMKGPGKSVFDLEERFGKEAAK